MRRLTRRLVRILVICVIIFITYQLLITEPDQRKVALERVVDKLNINENPDEQIQVPKFQDFETFENAKIEDTEIQDQGLLIETDIQKYPIYTEHKLGNYEPDKTDKQVGIGEYGVEVVLDPSLKNEVQASIREYGFNIVASDKISLDRQPEDLRHDQCKHWDYPPESQLKTVSVILVFHNEAFSTLVRTVHSVFNQSPDKVLKEIVMIDDGSNKKDLKEKLEQHVASDKFKGKVKLFRNDKRHGLIRARCDGARKSKGDILVYLDAHCEASPNWLVPLIMPIIKNRKACTCPLVDVIDGNKYTFTAQAGGDNEGFARGAWDWDLLWKRVPLTKREKNKRKYLTEPYNSPAMAGGLFAIDKSWFFELGLYDEELEIWGGENFELSYKLWMCGGALLFVPCSRVGHIYRLPGWGGNPPQVSVHKNFVLRNYRRVIDVWWDDYAKYFYERRPEAKNVDVGNLTAPFNIKKQLNCKSFEWFLKEIAYDIPLRYPLNIPDNGAHGHITLMNEDSIKQYCIDANYAGQGSPIKISNCKSSSQQLNFMLTWHEDIRTGSNKNSINEHKMCFDCTGMNHKVTMWECHGQGGNELWKYNYKENVIKHAMTGGCLTADLNTNSLSVRTCGEPNQKWAFSEKNIPQLDVFNSQSKIAVLPERLNEI